MRRRTKVLLIALPAILAVVIGVITTFSLPIFTLGPERMSFYISTTAASDFAVNEITVIGSRCGPFNEAINALVNQQVDVESMISRQLPLSKGLEAFRIADDPRHIKILLKVGS